MRIFIVDGLCDSASVPGSAVRALAQVREAWPPSVALYWAFCPGGLSAFFDLGFEGHRGWGWRACTAVGDTVLLDERMPAEHVQFCSVAGFGCTFYVWQRPDRWFARLSGVFDTQAGLNPDWAGSMPSR